MSGSVPVDAIEPRGAGSRCYNTLRRWLICSRDRDARLRGPYVSFGRPFIRTIGELEIVETIVAGCGNKEIADRFDISEHTVKHHLTRIFEKTGASSRPELAVFALEHFLKDGADESSTRTA